MEEGWGDTSRLSVSDSLRCARGIAPKQPARRERQRETGTRTGSGAEGGTPVRLIAPMPEPGFASAQQQANKASLSAKRLEGT